MSLNKIFLIGRLGQDATLKITQNGLPILNASIATFERFKDKDNKIVESTTWHRLLGIGKRFEAIASYLTKGKQVFVEGKLQTRSYEDKDGIKRNITDVVINNITLLGEKPLENLPEKNENLPEKKDKIEQNSLKNSDKNKKKSDQLFDEYRTNNSTEYFIDNFEVPF